MDELDHEKIFNKIIFKELEPSVLNEAIIRLFMRLWVHGNVSVAKLLIISGKSFMNKAQLAKLEDCSN